MDLTCTTTSSFYISFYSSSLVSVMRGSYLSCILVCIYFVHHADVHGWCVSNIPDDHVHALCCSAHPHMVSALQLHRAKEEALRSYEDADGNEQDAAP